jgi:hypothetical protein
LTNTKTFVSGLPKVKGYTTPPVAKKILTAAPAGMLGTVIGNGGGGGGLRVAVSN